MGRSAPFAGHDVGASVTDTVARLEKKATWPPLKDVRDVPDPSFASYDRQREHHHEYGVHTTGFQTRHQSHGGSVQGTPDGFQHRESSQGARASFHDGHHAGGFSNRTQDGIHRFEPERI